MARVSPIGAGIREWARVLGLAALCACSLPAAVADDLQTPGVPLRRSEHPRAGQLAYRLEAIHTRADGVRVEVTLMNGSGTSYQAVAVRVIALGPLGERQAVRLPVGGLGRGESRRLSARFPALAFPVADVALEMLERT